MRTLQFKKKTDLKNKIKTFSITQKNEDKQCVTRVHKSCLYNVSPTAKMAPVIEQPQVYIKKCFNSDKGIETFKFKVIGNFYITHNRVLFRVDFKHFLMIHIKWKNKIFSPKKSEILT